jgi:hypothetical protein
MNSGKLELLDGELAVTPSPYGRYINSSSRSRASQNGAWLDELAKTFGSTGDRTEASVGLGSARLVQRRCCVDVPSGARDSAAP